MRTVSFREFTGPSRLFLDFISCNEPACKYFIYDFKDISSYRQVAARVDKAGYRRDKLSTILQSAASSLNLSLRTQENIGKLARPDSLCVFTGQQIGMLLGPTYTVLKALSAYKLARRLENELGRPVVPCFWMATDDHDFDEIKTVHLLNRAGECVNTSYEPPGIQNGIPMADVILEKSVTDFLTTVEQGLLETEFSLEIKRWLGETYQPGKPLSVAFAGLFEMVLKDLGVIPVDPNYPGMKAMFAPVFREEIENHVEIFEIFEARSRDILEAGYHRQVHKTGASLNLFVDDGVRRNIMFDGKSYHLDGHDHSLSKDDLLRLLDTSPEKFSGNVALRPIAQCFAFPTVAEIVGPSEAAYFAQVEPMFEYHHVPWPVVKPRIFATLMEPHIKKTFEKLSIDFAKLYSDAERETGRVIKEKFPPETQSQAENLRVEVEKRLRELAEPLKRNDPESYQAIEYSQRRIDHELNHLSKRLLTTHKNRHDTARNQIYRAAAFLFPIGKFQERVLSPIYFANKFGPGVFNWLESKLDIDTVDHQIVEIET